VLTERQTLHHGLALLVTGILIGVLLAHATHWTLLVIGLVGVFIGWAYSAPPFALNSRGWGELCVALGFGLLIPIGTVFVQQQTWNWEVLLVSLPYGLLVTNILYLNQFPDRQADAIAGKHHWVVRLGPEVGKWVYVTNVCIAAISVPITVSTGMVPPAAYLALVPMLMAARAAVLLVRHARHPAYLVTPIKLTIACALTHGLVLAAVLTIVKPTG